MTQSVGHPLINHCHKYEKTLTRDKHCCIEKQINIPDPNPNAIHLNTNSASNNKEKEDNISHFAHSVTIHSDLTIELHTGDALNLNTGKVLCMF